MKESCPGSKEITSPTPETLVCVFCHHKNEIWSDEADMTCKECGKTITRDMVMTCIEWCPAARECIGQEKYERLMKKIKEQNAAST